MGGQTNLTLSSHKNDDQEYYAKRNELRQYLPQLEAHLNLLKSRGFQWVECGLYSILHDLYKHLTEPTRVPYHVLLSGEDLLKREVLQQDSDQGETHDGAVECLWRSSQFRSAIKQKFDQVLNDSPAANDGNLDSSCIEQQVFAKAKSKDEYLELSARVIIHLKHCNKSDEATEDNRKRKLEHKDNKTEAKKLKK